MINHVLKLIMDKQIKSNPSALNILPPKLQGIAEPTGNQKERQEESFS